MRLWKSYARMCFNYLQRRVPGTIFSCCQLSIPRLSAVPVPDPVPPSAHVTCAATIKIPSDACLMQNRFSRVMALQRERTHIYIYLFILHQCLTYHLTCIDSTRQDYPRCTIVYRCLRLVLFLQQLMLPRQRGEVAEVVFDKLGDRLWRSSREMPSPEEAKGHVVVVLAPGDMDPALEPAKPKLLRGGRSSAGDFHM